MVLSVAGLSVPLELTPCETFQLPRIPSMKPLRLFSTSDYAKDDAGDTEEEATAGRAARFVPFIAPSAPRPPARPSETSALASSPPPRPMITDSHIMRLVSDGRIEMFPAVPPPSSDGNGVVMLSCYQRRTLLPPTPPRPTLDKSDRIMWDCWQTQPVPKYHGHVEPNTRRGMPEWQHVPFACPFLRPDVEDVDRVVRGGDTVRWSPKPLVGPQVFSVKDTGASGVSVVQRAL
ncbi:hypothetical protein TRSC58_05272 [Trypanosoma rangeli SC58]|nr:hypothetical protein TRSC58_05272 [Trypanosoma rangeli SC58]